MRTDGPSLTALGVAAERLRLERPATPTGDADADERLARSLLEAVPEGERERGRRQSSIASWVGLRTPFLDDAVLRALAGRVRQIVIAGAGYDGRALRFRTPGVRFIELDHPLTQADKRARLDDLGIDTGDITYAAADFAVDDIDAALHAAGHDATQPTLFICEGVLRYLPEAAWRALLAALARNAAPGSELTVTISTRDDGDETDDVRELRLAREAVLADIGEAVLTVPPWATAQAWLAHCGWEVVERRCTGSGRNLVRAAPRRG